MFRTKLLSDILKSEYNLSVESNQNAKKCGVQNAKKNSFLHYRKRYVISKYAKMRMQLDLRPGLRTLPLVGLSWLGRGHLIPTPHTSILVPAVRPCCGVQEFFITVRSGLNRFLLG